MSGFLIRSLAVAALTATFAGSAAAGMITYTDSFTAQDNTGPIVVTIGGTNFQAYKQIYNGAGAGTASGFASLSGAVTFQFSNYAMIDAGYGYSDTGPGAGAYFDFYQGGTLIAYGDAVIHTDYASDGSASGSGLIHLTGPTDSAFYQEVLGASNGDLYLTVTSTNLLSYTSPQRPYDPANTAVFQDVGTMSDVPEPAALGVFGLLLPLLMRRNGNRDARLAA